MKIYMQIDGVQGDVSEKEHLDWIELMSMNMGMSNYASMTTGEAEDRQHILPNFSECRLIKDVDIASNRLLQLASTSTFLTKVVIHFCDTKGIFMEYELENVLITHREINMDSGLQPTEILSLSYSKMYETLNNRDKNNKEQAPQRCGYDVEMAKAC